MFRSARFIEEETPPADAAVVDQTWRQVNRKGGPDRRFNNNRKLPIGRLCGKIDLRSSDGVNQRIQCSRLKQPRDLSHPSLQCLLENAIAISASHGAPMRAADRASDRKRPQAGGFAKSMLLAQARS